MSSNIGELSIFKCLSNVRHLIHLEIITFRISNRGSVKLTDGSLSDTQAYAEVKTDYSSYAMWLKHSNTASSRLSEGDSLESLGIGSPRGHKMIHRESPYSNSPRLNRSNSIRYSVLIHSLHGQSPVRVVY